MTRLLASIVILCTQVLAVFGAGNLVLCVREDGECAVEFAGSGCCREAHDAEERTPPADGPSAGAVMSASPDRCRDMPWKQDRTILVRSQVVRSEPSNECRAASLAIVAWAQPVTLVAVRSEHPSVRGPPREPVPRTVRPFVLRC